MRLFTPVEAQKRSRNDDALRAARGKELSDAVGKVQIELATVEADFQTMLASQRARWAIEERDHASQRKEMDAEIAQRQEKLNKLLVPIEELEAKAENKLQEATVVLMRAKEEELHCELLAATLEDRLDQVSERELRVSTSEKTLDRREKGVKQQEKLTSQRAKALSEASTKFLQYAENREEALATRANELQAKEFAIQVRQEAIERREREQQMRETNFQDRYAEFEASIKKK